MPIDDVIEGKEVGNVVGLDDGFNVGLSVGFVVNV